MQPLTQPGRYRAEWGGFEVILVRPDLGACEVEIRRLDGGERVTGTREPRTLAASIEWAARWLEAAGASVVIGGQRLSLADFLAFQRIEP